MFLDYSGREDEEGPLTIESVDLRPGQLLELVDSATAKWSDRVSPGCLTWVPLPRSC